MAFSVVAALVGCGASAPPARGVLEHDLDSWRFRRLQKLLDVEVWVADTEAVAFAATYARKQAERRGELRDTDVVSAFVTRYGDAARVAPALLVFARRLARENGYEVEEAKAGDARSIRVRGHGEAWLVWPSGRHVVKVGGRNRDSVPDAVASAYADRYPSDLEPGALAEATRAEPAPGKALE